MLLSDMATAAPTRGPQHGRRPQGEGLRLVSRVEEAEEHSISVG